MNATTTTLSALKGALSEHPIYESGRTPGQLRSFMEHHVVCVLDFMSLVKSLQRDLTCMGPVWLPPANSEVARFINEIVLDEETDQEFPGEGPGSHFEWYVEAMDEMGANTGPIRELCADLASGTPPVEALERSALPPASREFGAVTFRSLEQPLHVRAAIFLHGREDIIPGMFLPLVRELRAGGLSCELLVGYLERHIEADGEHHGPLARRLLDELCGGDPSRVSAAEQAALEAVEARRALWDATCEALLA
ncbi:MAG: DUF3050 domain-containing protein [Planctomycetota bacterium]|nr:DUF3050 domain-containing protein [Planctomycetota bacterium]